MDAPSTLKTSRAAWQAQQRRVVSHRATPKLMGLPARMRQF
jgi:hypothetical protein